MKVTRSSVGTVLSVLLVGNVAVRAQTAVGTGFTYQGLLKQSSIPVNGPVDLKFRLYDAQVAGNQIAGEIVVDDWPLTKGMLQIELDFGSNVFNGDARWLEVDVRNGNLAGPYDTMTARHAITATPYAQYALNAGLWEASGNNISNTNSGFVGIGRSTAILPSTEFFGVLTPTGDDAYGGMHIQTQGASGWPYYGYSTTSGIKAWTYFDTGANKWHLYAGGPRLTVDRTTGNVGIGHTSPTAKLQIGGTAGVDGIRFPDGTLQTTAGGGGSLTLPFTGAFAGSDQTAFTVNQTGLGYAASFGSSDPGNYWGTLGVSSASVGAAVFATNSAGGYVAQFQSVSTANDIWPTVHAKSFGLAPAIYGEAGIGTDGTGVSGFGHGSGDGVRGSVDGSGNAIEGTVTNSFGRAAYFEVSSANSSTNAVEIHTAGNSASQALYALHTGGGDCGLFEIDNPSSFAEAVEARTNGSGDAVQAINTGTGRAGYFSAVAGAVSEALTVINTGVGGAASFKVTNPLASGEAVLGINQGGGPAAHFSIQNSSSTNTALFATSNGLGAVANFQSTNANRTKPVVIISGAGNAQPSLRVAGVMNVDVLEIEGGADLSEGFDVSGEEIQPGMVVVIDRENPGQLELSDGAYDRRVAGVISGAAGVNPGMVMRQAGSVADGKYPVALAGRVFCYADASGGAIEPGDLLVTSDTPGHAMKVADYARSQGAIIGKAMTGLDEGEKGLVLILVSLQ